MILHNLLIRLCFARNARSGCHLPSPGKAYLYLIFNSWLIKSINFCFIILFLLCSEYSRKPSTWGEGGAVGDGWGVAVIDGVVFNIYFLFLKHGCFASYTSPPDSVGSRLAAARSHSGENNTQLFSKTLVPLRYLKGKPFLCEHSAPFRRDPAFRRFFAVSSWA